MSADKISNFEIEQTSEREDLTINHPLDEDNEIEVPMPIITRGMKPAIVKKRSSSALIAIPLVFFLFVSILCYLQIRIASSPSFSEYSILQGVLKNVLESSCINSPIVSLRAITSGETCPPDHHLTPVGYWAGTQDGCYELDSGQIRKEDCHSPSREIPAISAKPMMLWKGYQLCVQQLLNYTVPLNYDPGACPEDTKFCRSSPGGICVALNSLVQSGM